MAFSSTSIEECNEMEFSQGKVSGILKSQFYTQHTHTHTLTLMLEHNTFVHFTLRVHKTDMAFSL